MSDLVVAGSDPTSPWQDGHELVEYLEMRIQSDFPEHLLEWRLYHPTRLEVRGTRWGKWRVESVLEDVRFERVACRSSGQH